jgi:ABC-type nitrate/sulfonate/bicarbonate transport system substrate-binding protein
MLRGVLFLVVVGAVLSGCARDVSDRPNLPARLVLEGPAAAQHVGLYVAAVRGYDEAEGVMLRIVRASSPATGPRQLRSGQAQFAVLDLHTLARERERGRDLVAVMALVQRPVAAFARQALGRDVDLAGAPRYPELVLATTRETLVAEPALVRATVVATQRGYDEEIIDPAATADVMLSRVPRLDRDALLSALARIDDAFTGPDGEIGSFDLTALRAWAAWEARAGIVREPPDVALAFVPPRSRDGAR